MLDAGATRPMKAAPLTDEMPVVPGYDLERVLGRGGMGVVYLARDRQLGRLVALKMILAGVHAEAAELVRFQTEARAVAALSHPGIVQLLESGEQGGLPYFTLEYLPGGSLAGRIQSHPLPPTEAARVVRALAQAMAYAHDRGVVHRDLKPENVLFGADDAPRVSDFGLARLERGSGATGTREVLGTPDYMAPEQARGDTAHAGPPADIWALGAILYRLVTGRVPFQAPTGLDTLRLVLDVEPVPVRALAPGCPVDLETIALKCLQKAAIRRYASAHDLADDLAHFLAGRPITARPVGLLERAAKWLGRNRLVAGFVAAIFSTILTAAVVAGVLAWRANAAAELAESRRDAAERAEERAQQSAADEAQARRELAVELARSRSSQFAAHLARVAPLPDAVDLLQDATLFPPDLRDPAWGLLVAQSRRGRWSLPRVPDTPGGMGNLAVAFDPTGRVLARASRGSLAFVDVFSGRTLRAARPTDDAPRALAYSPDGRWLYGIDRKALYQWEAATGRFVRRWAPGGEEFAHLATTGEEVLFTGAGSPLWSVRPGAEARAVFRGGAALAVSAEGGLLALGEAEVFLQERATGKVTVLRPAEPARGGVRCLAFGAGGRLLAVGYTDGALRLWDVASRRELFALAPRAVRFGVGAVAFHPSRPLLAAVHGQQLALHSTTDGHATLTLPAQPLHPFAPVPLCFRPDGEQLLYLAPEMLPTLVDALPRLAAFEVKLATSGLLATRPDGAVIVLGADRQGVVRDGRSGAVVATWPELPAEVIQVSPGDEGRLTLHTRTGLTEVRDLRTGAVVSSAREAALPPSQPNGRAMRVSPDGRTLASYHAGDRQLRLRDVATNELRYAWTLPGNALDVPLLALPCDLTFSPDGQRLFLLSSTSAGAILRGFDVRWQTAEVGDSVRHCRAAEQIAQEPWNPEGYERLGVILNEQGERERAALYLAWGLWQRR